MRTKKPLLKRRFSRRTTRARIYMLRGMQLIEVIIFSTAIILAGSLLSSNIDLILGRTIAIFCGLK